MVSAAQSGECVTSCKLHDRLVDALEQSGAPHGELRCGTLEVSRQ